MNTKAIIGIILGTLVVLGVIIFLGRPATGNPSNTPDVNAPESALKASETRFDFGTISMAKGKVSHAYAVTNTGTEPLIIKKVYTSCMCTTASLKNGDKTYGPFGMPGHAAVPSVDVSVAPGASVEVEAVFDPAAHGPAGVGPISRAVILENSAGKPLEVGFIANVTP